MATKEQAEALVRELSRKLVVTFSVEEDFNATDHYYIIAIAPLGGDPPDLNLWLPIGWTCDSWGCPDQRSWMTKIEKEKL